MYAPRCIKSGTIDITEIFRLAVHNSINAFPVNYFTTIFSSNIFPYSSFYLRVTCMGKALYAITRWLIAAWFFPQITLLLEQDIENNPLLQKPQSAFFTTVHL